MNKKIIRSLSTLVTLMVCLFIYSYFFAADQEKDKPVTSVDNPANMYVQVVYIDEDQTLVPIMFEIEKKDNVESNVYEIYGLMKDCKIEGLNSIFSQDLTLESSKIENGVLNLNFSSALNDITSHEELRFIEGIGFVFNNIEGIDGVKLSMNNQTLDKLPNGTISLKEPIDKTLGINNFESASNDLHLTTNVTVYYSKKIHEVEYYVPVSKRVNIDDELNNKLEAIVGEISVSSNVTQASALESLQLLEGSFLENGVLTINLNSAALYDELTINKDVYDLLMLSLKEINGVQEVKIQVYGENVEEKIIEDVSNITYNVRKL